MNERPFYVYEHWRPDRDECFYVGMGKGRRGNDMRRARVQHHRAIQAALSRLGMCVEVRIVRAGLTQEEGYALEIERIAFWRAAGVDLVNRSSGGPGPSGHVHTEEHKRLVSEKLKGREFSAEHRAKLSEKAKARRMDEETRRKISETKKAQNRLKREAE